MKRCPIPVQHARQVAVGVAQLVGAAAVRMVGQCRIKTCVVFQSIHVFAAVSAVVVHEFGQPFVNSARIGWVGDARLVAPAEQRGDIVRVDDAPTGFAGALLRPAFDSRKHAFDARLVAPNSKGTVERVVLSHLISAVRVLYKSAACASVELRHQVFAAGKQKSIRIGCIAFAVEVLRQLLAGFSFNRRQAKVPAETENPIAAAGTVSKT